ncbi:MAG: hypothetical protein IBX55_23395 [Methyloprofundus sp.]|nr:hypothetical protein [Methyloprofundus sp.]
MSGFSLKPFFADLYQECPSADYTQAKKRLKIDGDGQSLKVGLGLGKLKSCDFLTAKAGVYQFIEISDLKAQYQSLQTRAKQLKKYLTTKELKTCFYPKEVIAREFREKYLHTLLILDGLEKAYALRTRPKKQFLIVLCESDATDVMAFQFLVSKLSPCLDGLVDKVEVLSILDLKNRLSS